MLKQKRIILAVTGSIAAYKTAVLTRLLIKQEAEVQVIMTPSAIDFITPLTLSTLSKKPVLVDFVKDKTGLWNNHVELGLWADIMLIAPASANSLAKCAGGICDNLAIATYLSAKCPVLFAPAMDLDMYKHPSTQENLAKLAKYGNYIIPSEFGELASGLVGEGRMAEPEHIIKYLEDFFIQKKELEGKNILITAGPTQEAIDPVRYITNHSSGKMGYAIAENLASKGAKVQLVSGPTNLEIQHKNIQKIPVLSAEEMYMEASRYFKDADIAILAAAVADYTPKVKEKRKIKKKEGENTLQLDLIKTIDIAKYLGQHKKTHQILVGFALETNNEFENALKKIKDKNFDLIVLNSLNDKGAGFGYDTNKVTIIDKSKKAVQIPLKSKKEVAEDIVRQIIQYQKA